MVWTSNLLQLPDSKVISISKIRHKKLVLLLLQISFTSVFIVNFERFQGFSYGSLIYYVHKIFRKSNIFYLLIRTRACACQGVRNIRFLEDFANAINEWSLRTLSNTHNGVNFAKIVKQGICWDLGKEVCN